MAKTEVRRAEEALEHLGVTNKEDPTGESGEYDPGPQRRSPASSSRSRHRRDRGDARDAPLRRERPVRALGAGRDRRDADPARGGRAPGGGPRRRLARPGVRRERSTFVGRHGQPEDAPRDRALPGAEPAAGASSPRCTPASRSASRAPRPMVVVPRGGDPGDRRQAARVRGETAKGRFERREVAVGASSEGLGRGPLRRRGRARRVATQGQLPAEVASSSRRPRRRRSDVGGDRTVRRRRLPPADGSSYCCLVALVVLRASWAWQRAPGRGVPRPDEQPGRRRHRGAGPRGDRGRAARHLPDRDGAHGRPARRRRSARSRSSGSRSSRVVFDDDVPVYFARQLVAERLTDARGRIPDGPRADARPGGDRLRRDLPVPHRGRRRRPDDEEDAARLGRPHAPARRCAASREINSWGGLTKQFHVARRPAPARPLRPLAPPGRDGRSPTTTRPSAAASSSTAPSASPCAARPRHRRSRT